MAYMVFRFHILSLVLCDVTKSYHKEKIYFGTFQTIYNVNTSSTKRWEDLLEYIDKLTLKYLYITCWEHHIAVKNLEGLVSDFEKYREIVFCSIIS